MRGRLDADLDLSIQLEPIRPLDPDTLADAAIRVACANTDNAAEARMFIRMLGLEGRP